MQLFTSIIQCILIIDFMFMFHASLRVCFLKPISICFVSKQQRKKGHSFAFLLSSAAHSLSLLSVSTVAHTSTRFAITALLIYLFCVITHAFLFLACNQCVVCIFVLFTLRFQYNLLRRIRYIECSSLCFIEISTPSLQQISSSTHICSS